jgi:hypothetical protein
MALLIEQEEYRSSGVQEFRSSGVQEFRSSGVQEFRSSGVQATDREHGLQSLTEIIERGSRKSTVNTSLSALWLWRY